MSINKYLVVLSMAMMHACISPESIPGSKHVVLVHMAISCQKPYLTLVYYSASTVFPIYVLSKDSNSLAAWQHLFIYLFIYCSHAELQDCGVQN